MIDWSSCSESELSLLLEAPSSMVNFTTAYRASHRIKPCGIKPCVLKIKDSPFEKVTPLPWDSTPTMAKGRRAQTTFPDCGFLSYCLCIMQYSRYKQFISCRVVRWPQEGSMQYMQSTVWTKQWMDPERKSTISLTIGYPCPFCLCPAE